MPACPSCHQDFSRRKSGCCPVCNVELQVYRGVYYRADVGNPAEAIVKSFEAYISEQTSKKQGLQIPFHFPRKSNALRMELIHAQRILDTCETDLELTMEVLKVAFTNQQFAFKTRTSLSHLNRDLPLLMSIARAVLQKRRNEEVQRGSAFDTVLEREDIFAK